MKEKEFFQLLEALPFGIVMLDGDDRVVCRNGTAKDILEKLAHFSGGATLESLDIYAWKDLKKYSSLPVFVVHAGRKYQVSIRDSVGGAHLLLFQDVTLQAEKRSQEILRARLQTAEDILKVLTHSFNNILTVFFAYSERLLKKSEPGSPMAKALKEMLDVSGKGRALIEKIMTIRRKTKCLPVPVLLGHFFKGKRKSYEELVGKAVEFRMELNSGPLMIKIDSNHLDEIISELLRNACRASAGRKATVILELKEGIGDKQYRELNPVVKEGSFMTILLKDSGAGMSEEVRHRSLEPFFTTDQTREGLGLSRVYALVRQNGGDMTVRSEWGKGTEISLFFPLWNNAKK